MEILSPGAMIGNQRAGVAGRESGKQNVFRQLVSLLLPMVLLGPGCTATSSFLSFAGVDKPTGAPCRVAVMWIPEVRLTPDVVHGGARVPSLGGRVYLFGEEIKYPIVCEGRIVVDLFDTTPGKEKASLPLEEWRIDKDTLKRLEHRDAVGWGYNLALPWGTYKPEIKQVELRLRFEPLKSDYPLYADSAPVTFKNDMQITTRETQHIVKPKTQETQQTKAN